MADGDIRARLQIHGHEAVLPATEPVHPADRLEGRWRARVRLPDCHVDDELVNRVPQRARRLAAGKVRHCGRSGLVPVAFFGFDLLSALLWGISTVIYAWVVSMLWNLNPQGWLFVVFISAFNLILAVLDIIGASTFSAMLPAVLINGLVLLYCLLPSTKGAFGAPGPG